MGKDGPGLYRLYKGAGYKDFEEHERNAHLLDGWHDNPTDALRAAAEAPDPAAESPGPTVDDPESFADSVQESEDSISAFIEPSSEPVAPDAADSEQDPAFRDF